MGAWLRSQTFVTYTAIILAFTAGASITLLWPEKPNGMAVDGQTLEPGPYYIQYPYPGRLKPTLISTEQIATPTKTTFTKWKILLVIWDQKDRLVTIDSDNTEWKERTEPISSSRLDVHVKDGKKKFTIYWQPQP